MQLAPPTDWLARLRGATRWLHGRRRHERDAVVIFGVAASAFLAALAIQVLGPAADLHPSHWAVDAVLLLLVVLACALAIYAYRRIKDLDREVAARRQAQAHAHSFARHDPLTGLPNRGFFADRLHGILHRRPADRYVAVVMFDIDGFRAINKVHGLVTGDHALIEIAEGISSIMEPGTVLARIGGDEFAIIQPAIASLEETIHLAHIITAAIGRASVAGDTAGALGACIGVAVAPDDGTDADTLVRRADLALVRAKQSGRSTVCFYKVEMDAELERRGEIERAMRAALPKNIIRPHYQPLVSLAGDRIIGFEALARWNSPEFGPITPDVFIPIAEQCGLIQELGDRLLRQACRDAVSWPPDVTLAFNLSPRQLQDPALALRIVGILKETGLSPSRLEVEITESALVGDLTIARRIVDDLRTLGVRIALDDFGTGYATLSQLISLHFDKIKIDRSFIRNFGKDAESDVIVKAVIGLASGLGLTSLAEGIEDASQHHDLLAAGCMQGQGYLFGKAVPADQAMSLVRDIAQYNAAG